MVSFSTNLPEFPVSRFQQTPAGFAHSVEVPRQSLRVQWVPEREGAAAGGEDRWS
jgi:hypothetical protein